MLSFTKACCPISLRKLLEFPTGVTPCLWSTQKIMATTGKCADGGKKSGDKSDKGDKGGKKEDKCPDKGEDKFEGIGGAKICESGRCDVYDTRKHSPCLPKFDTMTCFEPLPNIPTGIFRCTTGEERLGPCACKCWYYKNPEYFSFHDMTFFDFHLILRGCRMPSAKSGRKPN